MKRFLTQMYSESKTGDLVVIHDDPEDFILKISGTKLQNEIKSLKKKLLLYAIQSSLKSMTKIFKKSIIFLMNNWASLSFLSL